VDIILGYPHIPDKMDIRGPIELLEVLVILVILY